MGRLAEFYWQQGRNREAEPLVTEYLETARRLQRPIGQPYARVIGLLGAIRFGQGSHGEAEVLLHEALTNFDAAEMLNRDPSLRDSAFEPLINQNYTRSLLGASLAVQKRFTEAEPLLLLGYQGLVLNDTHQVTRHSRVEQAAKWIVQLYQEWGKLEKATEWQEKLKAAHSFETAKYDRASPKGALTSSQAHDL